MNKMIHLNSRIFRVLSYKTISWLVLPFLLIVICFFIVYKKPLYIIQANPPQKNQAYLLYQYTDSIHGGKTTVSTIVNAADQLTYQYTLKDGYQYKFVLVGLYPADSQLINLSNYDYIRVKIKARHGSRIQVVLSSYEANHTEKEKGISYRLSQYNLNVSDEFKEIKVPLNELYTPDWWYTENNKKESDFGPPDFSKVTDVYFTNCINLKNDIEDRVDVRALSFHVDLMPFYLYSGLFLFFYYGMSGIAFWVIQRKKEPEINFNDEQVLSTAFLTEEEQTVFGYLSTHYYKQELTIIEVQKATGIAERLISSTIKKKTGLNFKQFLNKLRTVEAKRLLSETDLQVSEIAFKVGYSNASHFNRVFKTFEHCSPNDYRKKKSDLSK